MVFNRLQWWYERKPNSNNDWEYIPGMSETRLNQINDELKAQGFKCPEIRAELEYREKCRMNNIVLDTEESTTSKEDAGTIKSLSLYNNEQHIPSNVKVFNKDNYTDTDVDKVVDELYVAFDLIADEPLTIDMNPIVLEEDTSLYFKKIGT